MVQVSAVTEDQIDGNVAKAMLSQSPQCIKVLDTQGRLRFMSENGQDLMEITDFNALCGRDWWDLWPPDARETLQNAVATARRGVTTLFEAPCPTAGGTLKHWRVRVSPVTGGELDGMIVAASEDMTEQVTAEERRRNLEIDNLALRRFTRFVAHDLRGPIRHHKILAEIIGSSLELEGDRTEAPSLAEEIEKSARNLLDLLDGLEKLHLTDQTTTDKKEDHRLDQLCREAAEMTGATDMALECDCGGIALRADRGQMLALFSNLFQNAAKYGAVEGKTRVRVSAHQTAPDGITLLVSDAGPGFAPDRLDEVFQPLVRQSNSQGIKGSGLGLSLVQRIVESHGGTVQRLESHPEALSGAVIEIVLSSAPEACERSD